MIDTRALFVNHTSVLSGAEQVLQDIVGAVRQPSAYLFEEGGLSARLRERGVCVIQSPFGGGLARITREKSLWTAAPLIARMSALVADLALKSRKHDVIYANSQKAFVLGALAAGISRRPLIWHLHDIISASHFGEGQRRLQVSLANRFANMVIAPSAAVAAGFIAAGGRSSLVRVIPNGVDVPEFEGSKESLRREKGLPPGPLVGVFSRLAPWKGQHVVVRALAQLSNVHCIFVGGSLFSSEPYERCLRGLVAHLGLEDRVHFLGHRQDVHSLMRAVDVMVHPSVSPEPFALTILEAMAIGTPIVATNTGGSGEALDGGRAGTLVAPGNSNELARAIEWAFDGSDRPALVSAALRRAKEKYSVVRMRGDVERAIQDVLEGR